MCNDADDAVLIAENDVDCQTLVRIKVSVLKLCQRKLKQRQLMWRVPEQVMEIHYSASSKIV